MGIWGCAGSAARSDREIISVGHALGRIAVKDEGAHQHAGVLFVCVVYKIESLASTICCGVITNQPADVIERDQGPLHAAGFSLVISVGLGQCIVRKQGLNGYSGTQGRGEGEGIIPWQSDSRSGRRDA